MTKRTLTKNYHDSHVERIALGPRREVTLFIHLDPVWNPGVSETAAVRFGAIANFEEVERYFSSISARTDDGTVMAELLSLEEQAKNRWLVALEGYGQINIISSKCSEL